jgi:hypothetical protein
MNLSSKEEGKKTHSGIVLSVGSDQPRTFWRLHGNMDNNKIRISCIPSGLNGIG